MAVSKGRNMIQSDIDMKYEVLRAMIDDLPTFIGKIVGDVEKSKKTEVKFVAQGDKEIETDVAIHHPLNEYEDILLVMNPYIYQAMIRMIYSYAESTLAQFNSHDKWPKGNAPEIVKIISVLQRKYNIKERKVKKIKYYWKGFDEFRELRNHLVHEWANSKNPNKE